MKHLKKILLALVVVSMLVSAVVTIAVAAGDGDYTGSVEEAVTLIDEAVATEKVKDRQKLLASAYLYVLTVDPEDEGYADMLSKYEAATFKHAVGLYDTVVAGSGASAKSSALAELYVHLAAAPVISDDPEITLDDRYVCGVCGYHYFATEEELAEGLVETFICPFATCASKNTDYSLWTLKFSEFVELYEAVNLNIIDTFFDILYEDAEFVLLDKNVEAPSKISSIGYYDYLIVQTALKNYLNNALELKFVAPDNGYKGSVTSAAAILGKITEKSTVDEVKAVLAEVYTYITTTPIDPTTDEYADFYSDYYNVCQALAMKLFEAVDSAEGHENKIAVLTSIKEYLTATPLCQPFVQAFNAKVDSVIDEYANASGVLENENLTIPETVLPTTEYTTADELKALLDAWDLIGSEDEFAEDRMNAVVALFGAISVKPLDPAAEDYEALITRYNEARDSFIEEMFASVEGETDIAKKAEALIAIHGFLSEHPLTSGACERYNAKAAEIKAVCDAALEKLTAEGMEIEFVMPEQSEDTVTEEMLEAFLAEVVEAETLADKMAAETKLYTYLMVSNINDPSVYSEFIEAYNAVKNELTEMLLATIADAGADKKVDAFKAVSAYLASTPYSKAAVVAFNGAVDAAARENAELAEALNPLKLTCVLIEIDTLVAAYDKEADLEAKKAAVKAAYDYTMSHVIDLTDSDFMATAMALTQAFDDLNASLMESITSKEDINEKLEALDAVREYLLIVPTSPMAYEDYNTILNDVIDTASTVSEFFTDKGEESVGTQIPLEPALVVLGELMAAVNEAEDAVAKMDAFATLYQKLTSVYVDVTEGKEFTALYAALVAEIEKTVIDYVDSFINPNAKVEALRVVKSFIENSPLSLTAITKYNEKLEAVKNSNYSKSAAAISAAFSEALVYTTTEGFSDDIAALHELAFAITDKDTLFAAYRALAGNKYDFLATGYAECIAEYDAKKTEIGTALANDIDKVSDEYVKEINDLLAEKGIKAKDAAGKEIKDEDGNPVFATVAAPLYALYKGELTKLAAEHIEALNGLYNLLKTDCISSEMVKIYNEKRNAILFAKDSYVDLHEKALTAYSKGVKTLHDHMAACPVDDLGSLGSMLDGVEYAELEGYVICYNLAENMSKTPHIYRNVMIDKINAYLKLCSVSRNYSGFESFLTLYKSIALDYVNGLLQDTDSEVDVAKKVEALNSIKTILNSYPFSAEVVKAYNDKIDALVKDYTDTEAAIDAETELNENTLIVAPEYVEGAVEALNGLLEKVEVAIAGDDYDAKLASFAEVYTYLTNNRIDSDAEGFKEFEAAYETLRAQFYGVVMEKVEAAPTVAEKYTELLAVKEYLSATALSQKIVDGYNETINAIAKACRDANIALIGDPVVYTSIPNPDKDGYYPGDSKPAIFQALVKGIEVDLANPEADIDLDAVSKQIESVHKYLRNKNTLINVENPKHAGILKEYSDKCEVFFAKCMDAYNKATTPDAKAEALIAVYPYVKTAPFSKEAADTFNDACKTIGDIMVSYAKQYEEPAMKVTSSFDDTSALMGVVDQTAENIIKYMRAFSDFYQLYNATIFDITDPKYAELIEEYETKCAAIAGKIFETVDNATTPSAKYAALINVRDYITAYPINATSIEDYNAKLAELKAIDFANDAEAIKTGCEKISYTGIYYKGTVADLNEILADTESEKIVVATNAYNYLQTNKIDPEADGYTDAMAKYKEIYDAALAALIEAANAKTDANEIKAAYSEIAAKLSATPFSAEAVDTFNEALVASGADSSVNAIVYYTGTTEAVTEILSAGGEDALKAVFTYLEAYRIDSHAGSYNKINSLITAAKQDLVEKTEIQKEIMNSQATLDDYSLKGTNGYYNVDENFEKGTIPWGFNWENPAGGTYHEVREEKDANGRVINKYDVMVFESYSTSPFYDIKVGDTSKGIILEFDVTSPDLPAVMSISCTEWGLSTNARVTMYLGYIEKGSIKAPASGGNVILAENVVVSGEWTHVAYAYDPETLTMKVYVEYEYVGEYPLTSSEPINFTTLRLTTTGSNGSYRALCLDNFRTYPGTSPRTPNKYDSMNDVEKFNYYVDYFQKSTNTPTNRNMAYQYAMILAENDTVKAQCTESLAVLKAYDYNANILGDARKEALDRLALLIGNIGTITTENTQNKLAAIEIIEAFIGSSQYLDKADATYLEMMKVVEESKVVISHFANAKALLDALSRFDRATTLTSMTKHKDSAKAYYDLCKFDVEGNYDVVKDDPLVVEFLEKVKKDTLMDYYESMDERIKERTKTENSQRIIDCVKFIQILEGYKADATPEEKKAFWDANYEYIDKYVLIIRNVASGDEPNYDPEYEDVEEYIAVYNEINEYFYENLQNQHIAVISERLAQYPESQSYIEKKGICVYINNYFKENDIDFENEEIIRLKGLYEVYNEEVESFKAEYQQLLNQNTAAFIALVDRMDANSSNFKVLVELVNEANDNFYYGMNVDFADDEEMSARVNKAINSFKSYSAYIDEVVEASKAFVKVARNLSVAKTDKDIYLALVECSKYIAAANDDAYDGVAAAKELYETKLAAYNASIVEVNEAISDANDAVCAVRTTNIAQTVLSILKNIFTK